MSGPVTTIRASVRSATIYANPGGSAIYGLGDRDILVGSASDDVFYETAAPGIYTPTIYGRGGQDQVYGSGSAPVFVSPDLVRESTVRFVPAGTGSSQLALASPSQGLLALDLSEIRFIDGTVTYDPAAPAAQVKRLYLAVLGRVPDADGAIGYATQLQRGVPLTVAAAAMLSGPEAVARLGGTDAAGFVTRIYQAALGRAPEATALAELTRQLNSGVSRATVLTGISESAESRAVSGTASPIFTADQSVARIAQLYDTAFGRLPDAAGLKGWAGSLTDLSFSSFVVPTNFRLTAIAGSFATSAEFRGLFGTPTDAAFVQIAFQNSVHRAPTAAEQSFWQAQLASGTGDRSGVLLGISDRAEHQVLAAPRIDQGIVTQG